MYIILPTHPKCVCNVKKFYDICNANVEINIRYVIYF